MKQLNENEVEASLISRKIEQSASISTDKMVHVDLSAMENSREEALRKRGLLGPLPRESLRQRCINELRKMMASASLRVWAPVLGKALGTLGMLSCVALLGFHSRADDTYGAVISPESHAVAREDSLMSNRSAAEQTPVKSKEETPTAQCPVPPPCVDAKQPGGSPKAAGVTADGKIILNEASADELTRLPSVGPARAEAIVALRERLKGFRKISDLLRVRGIGWRTLEKMKEKLVLDRPKPELPANEKPGPLPATPQAHVEGETSTEQGKPGSQERGDPAGEKG